MRSDDVFDFEYGYWFNLLNEGLYRKLDTALNLVQLVGGSAAALAALRNDPQMVVWAGVALATCAALSLLIQPGVKAEQHRVCKAQWRTLKSASASMTDEALRAAVADLQGTGPAGFRSLDVPAYNATLRATGQEDGVRRLSYQQRLVDFLA